MPRTRPLPAATRLNGLFATELLFSDCNYPRYYVVTLNIDYSFVYCVIMPHIIFSYCVCHYYVAHIMCYSGILLIDVRSNGVQRIFPATMLFPVPTLVSHVQ